MDWIAPVSMNLETVYKYFLDFAFPLSRLGPMQREDLIKYSEKNYNMPDTNEIFITNYSPTANNTALPAMFKLGMLMEKDKYINLTDAGNELFNSKIPLEVFFNRQTTEYQYYNPYYTDCGECNIFNYWILLKFMYELDYIDQEDAVYVALTLDKYDENTFNNAKINIKKLREIKRNNPDIWTDILNKEFPNKNNKSKAWQYERNHLKWTGLCRVSEKSSRALELIPSQKSKVEKILLNYPVYYKYKNKQEYSYRVGRSFNIQSYYHIFYGDEYLGETLAENDYSFKVKKSEHIHVNDNILLVPSSGNEDTSNPILVSVKKVTEDETHKIINSTINKTLKQKITKNMINGIMGG